MNFLNNKDGALMLIALVVMLFFSIWMLSCIDLANTEKKLSCYMYQSQQAQEAADGGVEWAIEEIWRRGLPSEFEEEVTLTDDIRARIKVTEKIVEPGLHPIDSEGKNDESSENEMIECRYCLKSTAVFRQSKRTLQAGILYRYSAVSPQPYESAVIEYYRWGTDI